MGGSAMRKEAPPEAMAASDHLFDFRGIFFHRTETMRTFRRQKHRRFAAVATPEAWRACPSTFLRQRELFGAAGQVPIRSSCPTD
jgi:hypothetical protein